MYKMYQWINQLIICAVFMMSVPVGAQEKSSNKKYIAAAVAAAVVVIVSTYVLYKQQMFPFSFLLPLNKGVGTNTENISLENNINPENNVDMNNTGNFNTPAELVNEEKFEDIEEKKNNSVENNNDENKNREKLPEKPRSLLDVKRSWLDRAKENVKNEFKTWWESDTL